MCCVSGASGDHVFVHMYPGHNEDFAGSDPSQLDTWVFDQVTVRYKHKIYLSFDLQYNNVAVWCSG